MKVMDYGQIKEARQADYKFLEEERIAFRKRAEYFSQIRGSIVYFENNQAKLDKIQEWYPKAYRVLEKFLPSFVQRPDDMPPCVRSTANGLIYTYFKLSDRQILLFN